MFETVTQNLEKRNFTVSCFATAKEASSYLNKEIDGQSVAFGGSVTLDEMGLYDSRGTHNSVVWHVKGNTPEEQGTLRKKAMDTSVYISSVNGLAETGEIINIDGSCNRVSSVFFGHERVYLVVGRNKLRPDYDSALDRARNIASPLNAKRLGRNTPCAEKADHCYDCSSPERICGGLTVRWC